jgi:hypothetical protein
VICLFVCRFQFCCESVSFQELDGRAGMSAIAQMSDGRQQSGRGRRDVQLESVEAVGSQIWCRITAVRGGGVAGVTARRHFASLQLELRLIKRKWERQMVHEGVRRRIYVATSSHRFQATN